MKDNPYPTIDAEFFLDLVRKSHKINPATEQNIGTTYSFNMSGNKPIYKNQIVIRTKDGQIPYIQATGIAGILGFLSELLEWLETNRNWKSGGYFLEDTSDS